MADVTTKPTKLTREELRKKFFAPENVERKRLPFKYFGVDLEWWQPSVGMVAEIQDRASGKNFVVELLIAFSYIANTEDLFFEPEDYEQLINQPINPDFQRATNLIVTNINLEVDEKVKN